MTDLSTRSAPPPPRVAGPAVAGPLGVTGHRRAARLVALLAMPLIVYFLVRSSVDSDAAGLAIAGGSPLPLKLHEAAVTFVLGVVLLCAALARRPLPVGRVLKVPHSDRSRDTALSVTLGSFLMLHALLHLALALTLSTDSYLTVGRVVDWATVGVGAACLYGYVRQLRHDPHCRPLGAGRKAQEDDWGVR